MTKKDTEDLTTRGTKRIRRRVTGDKPLTPEQVRALGEMYGRGLSAKDCAAILDMSRRTLYRRLALTKGAEGTLEKARAACKDEVIKVAARIAMSGKHPVFTMFWLKCRARWTEKSFEERKLDRLEREVQTKDATIEALWSEIESLIGERRTWTQPIEVPPQISAPGLLS